MSSAERHPSFPDVPTFREQGFDLVSTSWFSLSGPAGMPAPIVQRLYLEMNRAATNPEIVEKLLDLGFVVDTANPEEFTSYIRRSNELFGKLVKTAKIEPE
jgi:hypothetical protein